MPMSFARIGRCDPLVSRTRRPYGSTLAFPTMHCRNFQNLPQTRREMLDDLMGLNKIRKAVMGDPEIDTRIAQYELAFRMQTSVPELLDLSTESASVLEMYGPNVKKQGSYAYNCLLARRLVERGVRFVQLYHTNWDHHGGPTENLKDHLPAVCKDVDQASAALVLDLKQRGLLEDTIVVWGGEFGRTPMVQGGNDGRDHHNRSFTMWLAGGGVKRGYIHGETDDLGFNVVRDPVHVHDLHATILHLLGFDHTKLTYRFQGRDFRLTDVHGHLVKSLLA